MTIIADLKTMNIVNGLLIIDPEGCQGYRFQTPSEASCIHVQGSFTTSGGVGNDIQMLIMDMVAFLDWQNHLPVRLYHDSGKLKECDFDVSLPAGGDFCIVFSNTFSSVSRKVVKAKANLIYDVEESY